MSPTYRTRSRTDVEQRRRVIVALLHQHQSGLTAREIREAIGLSRSLTDSALSGLFYTRCSPQAANLPATLIRLRADTGESGYLWWVVFYRNVEL